MDNIELYINGELCDTNKNFGVRLRRQLISPAELNSKDAQLSYIITLPPTPTNNRLFGYSIIEEIKGKFLRLIDAELIVNSYRVFKGRFMMNKIDSSGYSGNLVIPAVRSVKDVFGDSKLTDNAPLEIPFGSFSESVTKYNTNARTSVQPCIFPYVLYGILNKTSSSTDRNEYSARDLWDDTVRVSMEYIPPSINVLGMVKHIFEKKGYTITGSAFDDVRLNSLYVSYKNEADYTQPWNYGSQADIKIKGSWQNIEWGKPANAPNVAERTCYTIEEDGYTYYTGDLFNSTRSVLSVEKDSGANVILSHPVDENGYTHTSCQVEIPASGFYKIRLKADIHILNDEDRTAVDSVTGIRFVGGRASSGDGWINKLQRRRYEVKLLRDYGTGDFGLNSVHINKRYYRNNLNQNATRSPENSPKFFPLLLRTSDGKEKEIMLIDPAENVNLVSGLSWGHRSDLDDYNPLISDVDANTHGTVLAQKTGLSWDINVNSKIPKAAIDCPGYMRWGIIGYTPEEDKPVTAWTESSKFKTEVANAPDSYARIGWRKGVAEDPHNNAEGEVNNIVWLEKGELLTIAVTSDEGKWRPSASSGEGGWTNQNVNFELEVTPFRTDENWIKVDLKGTGTGVMDWGDETNFKKDSIDLVKFLPADVRTDEFIDNFCKAFNLSLSQKGTSGFLLNIKQTKRNQQYDYVDLDASASVKDKVNQPLGLPSAYSIGFTVNEDEEGFIDSGRDNGGGTLYTGASDGTVIEQKSNFSYNWFKKIRKTEAGKDPVDLYLPVISKAEAWTSELTYPEAMNKRFTNLAQRFWYYDGLLNDSGVSFKFGQSDIPLSLAKVSNALPGLSSLSYKDENNSILNNYFSLLTDANSHYTIIECFLQPDQYEAIGNGAKARFNGDMYYVADVDLYDPLNKSKATIKLIRLI